MSENHTLPITFLASPLPYDFERGLKLPVKHKVSLLIHKPAVKGLHTEIWSQVSLTLLTAHQAGGGDCANKTIWDCCEHLDFKVLRLVKSCFSCSALGRGFDWRLLSIFNTRQVCSIWADIASGCLHSAGLHYLNQRRRFCLRISHPALWGPLHMWNTLPSQW